MEVCMGMAAEDSDKIEICIERLIDFKQNLEEDGSTYSTLIPRLQARFDLALEEAQLVLEYERMLDAHDTI
jgi:hypothetical protein